MDESKARIQADNTDRIKLRERLDQCIDICAPSGHYATVFIVVSGKLSAGSVMV